MKKNISHDIQGLAAALGQTDLGATERMLAQAETHQEAINRAIGLTGSGAAERMLAQAKTQQEAINRAIGLTGSGAAERMLAQQQEVMNRAIGLTGLGAAERILAQAETHQEAINRAIGLTGSGAAERMLAQAETQQEAINRAIGLTGSGAAERMLAEAETQQEVMNRVISRVGLDARAEDYLKIAERQAAIISSKMLVPDTYQELIDKAFSIKAFSRKDPNYSRSESYNRSVALLSKIMLDSLSSETSSDDDGVEISQLLIGAALTVVSDFIDSDSANDSFFSESVIDAEYLFNTRVDKDDDSPDEIIEAYCDWIREYAASVKNDMSPKDTFTVVLTLVLFLLGLCF